MRAIILSQSARTHYHKEKSQQTASRRILLSFISNAFMHYSTFLTLLLCCCPFFFTGGLEVLIDGQIFQEFYNLSNVSVILNDSVAVSRPQKDSFLVTFPSGISVTVTDIQGSLSIVFAAPLSFQGQTKGLLGTWNDDQEDDFLTPDGNILPSNATGRQIHFDFGLKCKFI